MLFSLKSIWQMVTTWSETHAQINFETEINQKSMKQLWWMFWTDVNNNWCPNLALHNVYWAICFSVFQLFLCLSNYQHVLHACMYLLVLVCSNHDWYWYPCFAFDNIRRCIMLMKLSWVWVREKYKGSSPHMLLRTQCHTPKHLPW